MGVIICQKGEKMKFKYYTTIIVLILFAALSISESHAQGFKGLDDIPHDIAYYRESRVTAPLAKVIYGRPQKNGDEVFGKLVPYGKLWRTGANEATEVKFYRDVLFGDTTVAAGTYVLLSIPGEQEWEIILSSKLDVFGAFQYDPSFDVARITVPVYKAETLEAFSIAFKETTNNVQMVLGWDAARVKIPLYFGEENVLVNR